MGSKVKSLTVPTPIGVGVYLYLSKPDTGREYSDGKYKVELYIPKPVFKETGKELMAAILKVGRAGSGNPKATLDGEFKHPITDVDAMDSLVKDKLPEKLRVGMIRLRAKSTRPPTIVGPDKHALTAEAILSLKSGDSLRLAVGVYWYLQQGGGVALGLNAVQFVEVGEPLLGSSLGVLDVIDVKVEDVTVGFNEDDLPF